MTTGRLCLVVLANILTLAAFAGPAEAPSEAESLFMINTPRPLPEPRAPSPAELESVKAFLKDCFGLTEFEDAKVVAARKASYVIPWSWDEIQVTIGPELPDMTLEINPVSAQVMMFSWMEQLKREREEIGNRTHKDAISEDTAWNSVLPFLKHFKLSAERGQYRVYMLDTGTTVCPDDLRSAEWCVDRSLNYEGIPCPSAMVSLSVSAYSGRVLHAIFKPVVLPKDNQRIVTREDAVKRAKIWLEQKGRERVLSRERAVVDDAVCRTTEVIASPYYPWQLPDEPFPPERPGDSFYCWEVPFRYVQHGCEDIEAVLWVRMDNGNIIGGCGVSIKKRPGTL